MALRETDGGPNKIALEGAATDLGSVGVVGTSKTFEAVRAHSESELPIGALVARHLNPQSDGFALFAEKVGEKGLAGLFIGSARITRSLRVEGDIILPNVADFAEEFDVHNCAEAEPGTLMVLADDETLHPSTIPYDRRVAGVIAGAGHYKSGIVLDKQDGSRNRLPIALLGKVYCKAVAAPEPIEVGDLLTSSQVAGHAMKATDQSRAFGAVIGKALRPLDHGAGLIPVFVTLQ